MGKGITDVICFFIKLMGYGNFYIKVMGYGGWIYLSQRITQQLDISLTRSLFALYFS